LYPSHASAQVINAYIDDSSQLLSVTGCVVVDRDMDKATFMKLLDGDGKIQICVSQNDDGQNFYPEFQEFDIGGVIGIIGIRRNVYKSKAPSPQSVRLKRFRGIIEET
jgi:lysyl-tRNA synthetase class II